MSQATPPEGSAPGDQNEDGAALSNSPENSPENTTTDGATAPQASPATAPDADSAAESEAGKEAAKSENGGDNADQTAGEADSAVLLDDAFEPASEQTDDQAEPQEDRPAENKLQAEASDTDDKTDKADRKPGGEGLGKRSRPPRPTVVVRYGSMRSIGEFRHNSPTPIPRGTKLVIRSERGVELGEAVAPVCDECDKLHLTSDKLKQFIHDNGQDYPFRRDGRVLRLANPQDVIDYRHLEQSAKEAATYCRQQIRELKLDMRLVSVEHLLGGERLVFYFAAEHRVDFRELVRRLASQYRTRIEMRQVGARDEARLVADYERCGQQCCCQSFLKDLRPVSMRMAKTQKATLDPSKISGRCGRLMCCLRYEDTTYEVLRKKMPRKNTWVRTEGGVIGRVVDTQIITQLVKLQVLDGTFQAVANDDIVERNLDAPPKPEPSATPRRNPKRTSPRKRERLGAAAEAQAKARQAAAEGKDKVPAAVGDGGESSASPDAGADSGQGAAQADGRGGEGQGGDQPKKRRRRRRRRKTDGGSSGGSNRQQAGAGGQQTQARGNQGGQAGESGENKPKRRRRRRRKKPSGGAGAGSGQAGT